MRKLVETTTFRSGIIVLTYTPGPSGNGLFMRLGSGQVYKSVDRHVDTIEDVLDHHTSRH